MDAMKEIILLLSCLCLNFPSGFGDLSKSLRYYETFKDVHIHSVSKRSIDGGPSLRDFRFSVLGKDFRLILQKRKNFFSKNFKVVVQKENGEEELFPFHEDRILTGHVFGHAESDVSAYIEDDPNVLTAHIQMPDETYIIEPSDRHLDPSENYTMIAYRGSDVLYSFNKAHPSHHGESFCQFLRPEGGEIIPDEPIDVTGVHGPAYDFAPANSTGKSRSKRFVPLKESCPLILVADYKFHLNMGKAKLERTATYMIGVVDRVDKLYRSTVWDASNDFSGVGFEIKEIKIHEGYTSTQGGYLHYNMQKFDWDTKKLLEVFSRNINFKQYCLAHLFTHQQFAGGVLGLAYIASPKANTVGGVCSPLYTKAGYKMSLNTGWSSSLNTYGNNILTQEAQLVTAHELGHNFGSEHDPDTDQCAPSARSGGKYLMYPYAVSGYENNNNLFSPCSRSYVNQVLRFKSGDCFAAKSNSFCGNGIVEVGEDCDAGFKGKGGSDPCCTADCHFIDPAICSDVNHACCQNCQIAELDSFTCQEANAGSTSCLGQAKCDGISLNCPAPEPKTNGTECVERGECRGGICVPFCEAKGLTSCLCDAVADSCRVCCKHASGECAVYDSSLKITDGRPCVQGFCRDGNCEKTDADFVSRVWNIIDTITVNSFIEFMRSNIVGTVMILSLILWIPGSCIISCIDRRREKKNLEYKEWLNGRNRVLIRTDESKSMSVKNVNNVKLKRPMGSVVRDGKPPGTYSRESAL